MGDVGVLDVNTPSSGSKGPSPLLIGAGVVGIIAVAVLMSRKSQAPDSTNLVPSSSANIAFSSLENSLLNFQGMYTANAAEFAKQQQTLADSLKGLTTQVTTNQDAVTAQGNTLLAWLKSNSINTQIAALYNTQGLSPEDTSLFQQRIRDFWSGRQGEGGLKMTTGAEFNYWQQFFEHAMDTGYLSAMNAVAPGVPTQPGIPTLPINSDLAPTGKF